MIIAWEIAGEIGQIPECKLMLAMIHIIMIRRKRPQHIDFKGWAAHLLLRTGNQDLPRCR
jgi:hypothetical protein